MALVPTASAEKWTAEEISTFLDCLISYPSLWDLQSEEYKIRSVRDENFKQLQDDLKKVHFCKDVAIEALRKKIKNIRDTYAAEVRKVIKSKKTGTSESDVYKPRIPWFDQADSFLRGSVISRQSISTLNVSRPLVHNENGEEEEDADEPHPTDTDTSSYYIGRTTYNRTPHSRRLKSDEIMNGAISKLERLSSGKSDEFDGFGKSVASQLRRLPEDLAWEVQDKVTALLRESIRGTRKNAKGSELEATSSTAKGVQSSLTAPTAEVQSRRRSSSVSEHSINVGNQRSNQGKIISSHNPPQQNSQPVDLLDEHCENSANESFHQTEDDVLDDYWLSNEHPVTPPRDENENFDTMVIDVPSNSHIPVQPIENATSIVDEPLNSMNIDMPISSVIPLNSIENTMNSSKFKIPPLNSKKKVILRVKSKTEINKVCKPKVLRCNEDPLKKSSAISQLISKQPGFANILSKKKFVPLMGPANRTPVSVLQNINN